MISAWWLLLIVPASALVGLFLSALMIAGSEFENRKDDDE